MVEGVQVIVSFVVAQDESRTDEKTFCRPLRRQRWPRTPAHALRRQLEANES